MNDPIFNLLQLEKRPNWYDHLDKVEAMIAHEENVYRIRMTAQWTLDEGGWISPDGISESDWEHEYGYPFPEDQDYAEFASTYFHCAAADAGELETLAACVAAVDAAQKQLFPPQQD